VDESSESASLRRRLHCNLIATGFGRRIKGGSPFDCFLDHSSFVREAGGATSRELYEEPKFEGALSKTFAERTDRGRSPAAARRQLRDFQD
jgi:hypothetical protein